MNERSLAPVPQSVTAAVARLIAEGRAELRRVDRATEQTDRVIHRPHETVYETVTRTVEVFYFGGES